MDPVDHYIQAFPESTAAALTHVRNTIRENAPAADECISYGMPAYKWNGKPLVYFAGYKHHIGFYATPTGHSAFEEELSIYKHGKGSVQFPLDQPLPLNLIRRIVLFRIKEVSEPRS